jgi:hypothetical protein
MNIKIMLQIREIITKAQQTKFKITNKIKVFFRVSKYFATKPIMFANVMAIVYQNIRHVHFATAIAKYTCVIVNLTHKCIM